MDGSYGYTQLEWHPEVDPRAHPLWIAALTFVPKPWRPLSITQFLSCMQMGSQKGAEKIPLPKSKGWDVRIRDGYYYLAHIECKPEEVPEREKAYRKFMEPLIEDFKGVWDKWMAEEWLPVADYFRERCHIDQLKKLSDVELLELLEDYETRCHHKVWVDYYVFLYAAMDIYNQFADLCADLIGIDSEHPLFKRLQGGFDTIEFRINKELWRLGDRAKELGLSQLFLTTKDNEELMAELRESEKGRKWLEEFSQFLYSNGWRCIGCFDCDTPTWLEEPSIVLRDIKVGMAKGGPFILDTERERLIKEREEAEKEILAKVPREQRDRFAKLMKGAEKSSWHKEEHAVLTSHLDTAIARHLFMEYGRRFAEYGVIDKQDDVYFLIFPEIRRAAISQTNLRPYINKRRKEWLNNLKVELKQPFEGDKSLLADLMWRNPIIRGWGGVPNVRPELKADLYGASAVPGLAEGVARLVMSEDDLSEVQPGEVLVAVNTNSLWTPVFAILSAVVTDAGSSLAHAAIVAREYGIPAVVGTQEATAKIKTGMRLRVDGDNGCVYILQ